MNHHIHKIAILTLHFSFLNFIDESFFGTFPEIQSIKHKQPYKMTSLAPFFKRGEIFFPGECFALHFTESVDMSRQSMSHIKMETFFGLLFYSYCLWDNF